ncbi:glycosyltransferase [Marinobacter adhaerens]|uniref:glycosyltransferase n=1 Tax=Marinobacter adhaerens TaxID=1033846 RepID=UPI003D2A6468
MNYKSIKNFNRRILFVAFFYPPIESTGVPGAMRTVKFVRSFPAGSSIVLTSKKKSNADDNALKHLKLPVNNETIEATSSLDFFRVLLSVRKRVKNAFTSKEKRTSQNTVKTVLNDSAFQARQHRGVSQKIKDFIYDLCYFPDQAGPWLIPATIRGVQLVKKNSIDIVFATGSPWSGLVVGYLISAITRKPLVVDFRDPWMNNPFHQSKGKLLDSWSSRLERRVVESASGVSLNTDPLLSEFLDRYPDQPPEKFFVMPNGFDSNEFDDIEAEPRAKDDKTILLCHAGFLYGVRDPDILLRAIRTANIQLKKAGTKIVFRQIGNVNLGYDLSERFRDLVNDGSLILDATRPYRECLSALSSADVVVNVQPGTRTQIPSKLYDYLAINKPILNITSPDGALGELVTRKGLGDLVDFDQENQLVEILKKYANDFDFKSFSGYKNKDEFEISRISEVLSQHMETFFTEK